MPKKWSFAKYTGCGNDFVLFDNRLGNFPINPSLVASLCHRQYGIGADGILLLELSKHADCRMRIFNADGSEGEMCGNGLRCFIKWLPTLGINRDVYSIELMKCVLQGTIINEHEVRNEMSPPSNIQWEMQVNYLGERLTVHSINTGVPHVVLFMDEIESISIVELGRFLRYHPLWEPQGTNVNLVQITANQKIKVRTFERGVEGETLACGTGATAAALATAHLHQHRGPIIVETRSKEKLHVNFDYHKGKFSKIYLTGAASCRFTGEVNFENIQI